MTPRGFHDDVLAQFPEIAPYLGEGDEELTYLVVGAIVDWLCSVAQPVLPPQIVSRVVAFYAWALDQPRGQNASDDILTILTVGFVENLFAHDELLPLIPKLTTRELMLANRDYFSQWVGRDRYEKALLLFRAVKKKK